MRNHRQANKFIKEQQQQTPSKLGEGKNKLKLENHTLRPWLP